MIRVIFAPEAQSEFDDARRYYNRQIKGLGDEFREEIRKGLVRIQTWPLSCPVEQGDIRRLVLSRFPYKMLYALESDHLYVLAVAHQHRDPSYWVHRQLED